MTHKYLITKQLISEKNLAFAREMRHEMTPGEARLWAKLRKNQLNGFHFRRQQPISPYIVDFLCNPARLVIEVDGGVHLDQQDYDRERDLDLRSIGLRVLHFWNSDVNENIDAVLEEILRACRDISQPIPENDLPLYPLPFGEGKSKLPFPFSGRGRGLGRESAGGLPSGRSVTKTQGLGPLQLFDFSGLISSDFYCFSCPVTDKMN